MEVIPFVSETLLIKTRKDLIPYIGGDKEINFHDPFIYRNEKHWRKEPFSLPPFRINDVVKCFHVRDDTDNSNDDDDILSSFSLFLKIEKKVDNEILTVYTELQTIKYKHTNDAIFLYSWYTIDYDVFVNMSSLHKFISLDKHMFTRQQLSNLIYNSLGVENINSRPEDVDRIYLYTQKMESKYIVSTTIYMRTIHNRYFHIYFTYNRLLKNYECYSWSTYNPYNLLNYIYERTKTNISSIINQLEKDNVIVIPLASDKIFLFQLRLQKRFGY